MMKSQEKQNRPAWIGKLCEALAEGLEDDRLTKGAYEGLASIADQLIYDGAKNVSDDVRHLLPVFLERAINETENTGDKNSPAWIAGLVEHLEAAFKDKRLPGDVRDALCRAVSDIENQYSADVVVSQKPSLSIALERAISSTEDEDSEDDEHDDSEKPLGILAQELAEPLAAFLDHSRVPESIAGRITDALLELADIRRPGTSNGGLTRDALIDLATHPSN